MQTSKSSIEWEKEFDDERKDEKNQSTFFITVQQFFEDLLEDSAFEWLENCKNKTFLTASSVAIAVLGEAVMLIIIISKTLSRCSFITNLLYYNNIYDVKI